MAHGLYQCTLDDILSFTCCSPADERPSAPDPMESCVGITKLEIDGERQPRSGCIAKEDLKSVIVTTPTSGQKEFFFKKYQ